MSMNAERDWLRHATGGSVLEFYATIGVQLTDRGGDEAPVRCFADPQAHSHEDRRPSCNVNLLTGLWHCKGCGKSGNAYQAALETGRTETAARDLARRFGLFIEAVRSDRPRPRLPGERQLKLWRKRLLLSPAIIARLGEVRGWTERGIVRCGIGWDGERLTFPIRDHRLKIVGLVRYKPGANPKTLALPGSRRELFPAPEVTSRREPLFLVEGEPDAVAVWSLGLQAAGIPGAGSWRPTWSGRLAGRRIVMLADCDPQGRQLAEKVRVFVPHARVVDLEVGRQDGYDIGDLICEAAGEGGVWQARRLLEHLADGPAQYEKEQL